MDRAERRARKDRARNRFRYIIKHCWSPFADIERSAQFSDTRQRCQNPCCNRHRMRWGMNAQEMRARGLTRHRRHQAASRLWWTVSGDLAEG